MLVNDITKLAILSLIPRHRDIRQSLSKAGCMLWCRGLALESVPAKACVRRQLQSAFTGG